MDSQRIVNLIKSIKLMTVIDGCNSLIAVADQNHKCPSGGGHIFGLLNIKNEIFG